LRSLATLPHLLGVGHGERLATLVLDCLSAVEAVLHRQVAHHLDGAPRSRAALQRNHGQRGHLEEGTLAPYARAGQGVAAEASGARGLADRDLLVVHDAEERLEGAERVLHLRDVAQDLLRQRIGGGVGGDVGPLEVAFLPSLAAVLGHHAGVEVVVAKHRPVRLL
jgi:hypothetical protein